MTAGFDSSSARYQRQQVPDVIPAPYPAGPGYAPTPGYPPTPGGGSPPSTATGSSSSTTQAAKEQAGEVMDTAADAGKQVMESTKEQVGEVTAEAGRQARQLADQVRSEVTDQAATQQQRVAGGIRSLADELSGMADRSEQEGPATDLVRQAAQRMQGIAEWLQDRDPGSVLDEVRSFARRRPGMYLAIAAGAGVLAGRLTRGLTASGDDSSTSTAGSTGSSHSAVGLPPNGSPGGEFRPGAEVRSTATPSIQASEPGVGPVVPAQPAGSMPPVGTPRVGSDPWGDPTR